MRYDTKVMEMSKRFPLLHFLFMKIAEPRAIRIMQFGIYICMIFAGIGVLSRPPSSFENLLGVTLVHMLGSFVFFGALFGAIAVLPGIWWLERVGLICLITAMIIYTIVIVTLGSSPMGITVCVAFALTFAQRWTEIRKFQLAPRQG